MSNKRNKKRAKKRRKDAALVKRIIKAQKDEIDSRAIPERVTLNTSDFDDGEVYTISFLHYAKGECEIGIMTNAKDGEYLRQSLTLLKEIEFHGDNVFLLKNKGFRVRKVVKDNQYKKIYDKLERCDVDIKDATIYEAFTTKTGRIFFWIPLSKKIIYIIAIRKTHYQ